MRGRPAGVNQVDLALRPRCEGARPDAARRRRATLAMCHVPALGLWQLSAGTWPSAFTIFPNWTLQLSAFVCVHMHRASAAMRGMPLRHQGRAGVPFVLDEDPGYVRTCSNHLTGRAFGR